MKKFSQNNNTQKILQDLSNKMTNNDRLIVSEILKLTAGIHLGEFIQSAQDKIIRHQENNKLSPVLNYIKAYNRKHKVKELNEKIAKLQSGLSPEIQALMIKFRAQTYNEFNDINE